MQDKKKTGSGGGGGPEDRCPWGRQLEGSAAGGAGPGAACPRPEMMLGRAPEVSWEGAVFAYEMPTFHRDKSGTGEGREWGPGGSLTKPRKGAEAK